MKYSEYGSEFYHPIASQWRLSDPEDSFFLSNNISLFFSGRAALYHLLKHGIESHGWQAVYLPSYYCHEVCRYVKQLPLAVNYYPFNPSMDTEIIKDGIPDDQECVLVTVSFFGMDCANTSGFNHTSIIADLTHSLESIGTTQADYSFGSLRKELPVPVGGFCHSLKGRPLPKGLPHKKAVAVSEQKLLAMQLKYDYLKGNHDDKSTYRKAFAIAENQFEAEFTRASMPQSAIEILLQLNVETILEQKRTNLKQALSQLQDCKKVTVFETAIGKPTFGLVLRVSSPEERVAMAQYLIDRAIYPAVLWPGQEFESDIQLEQTLLFVHIDFRYDAKDISVLTRTIKAYYDHD